MKHGNLAHFRSSRFAFEACDCLPSEEGGRASVKQRRAHYAPAYVISGIIKFFNQGSSAIAFFILSKESTSLCEVG